MSIKQDSKIIETAGWLIILSIATLLIIYFKTFLLPLVVAIFLWYLIKDLRGIFGRIKVNNAPINKYLRSLLAFLVVMTFITISIEIFLININELKVLVPEYEKQLDILLNSNSNELSLFGISSHLFESLKSLDFTAYLKDGIGIITSFLGNFLLVVIYVALFLVEEALFSQKIDSLTTTQRKRSNLIKILEKMNGTVHRYLSVKTFMSFLTGGLSYLVLLLIGVDIPAFWAFIIFIFNFIPSVGSILATTFPALFSVLQFGSFGPFLWVIIGVGFVQFVVGNVLEPRAMGKILNLSPLIIILSLSFWGAIWGVIGMLISVPLTSLIMILLAQFESTQNIVRMVSQNGEIEGLKAEEINEINEIEQA